MSEYMKQEKSPLTAGIFLVAVKIYIDKSYGMMYNIYNISGKEPFYENDAFIRSSLRQKAE